jgi:hypothetical protein
MTGEDAEETGLLKAAFNEARAYLGSFAWVHSIREAYFGVGVGGVVSTFLFRIDAEPNVDEWLWVVVGDLPSCYLVTDRASDGIEALKTYCEVMEDWVETVRARGDLAEAFPVKAPPTVENAAALESRIAALRKDVIPALSGR